MKLSTKLLLIPTLIMSFLTLALPANAFSDVEAGCPYYVAISHLEKHGIVDGYNDGTFKPYEDINRAEALKMLTTASGLFSAKEMESLDKETARPFTDTPISAWYTTYLKSAKDAGVINGYDDGSFKPEQTITLVETLKILLESYNDIEYPEIADYLFNDTPDYEWFIAYTTYAASKGMINVYNTNTISPDQEMTRGYLAEIVYRKIMSDDYNFGKATFYGAALDGNYTASGEIFDMYAMTAAHKTLPFGTVVNVTNLANDKKVEVRITDRGPYGPGRVIDLSSGAFEKVASLGTGVINAQLEIVSTP